MEPSGGGCSSGAELEADAAIVSAAKLQSLWFWGRGGFCYVKVVDINLTDFIFSGCTLKEENPNLSSGSDDSPPRDALLRAFHAFTPMLTAN